MVEVVATCIITDNDRIVTGAPINVPSYVMPCGISFTINKGKKKIECVPHVAITVTK